MFNQNHQLYAAFHRSLAFRHESCAILAEVHSQFCQVLLAVNAQLSIKGSHVVAYIQLVPDSLNARLLKVC